MGRVNEKGRKELDFPSRKTRIAEDKLSKVGFYNDLEFSKGG